MAKQTFTTGQVLTAAQMNSLQSNDFNQTVSVKTASYTLVAADKGTRIEFNTSGSVTCTVNTGLFDAGDTLIIQNGGAGTVTVTAGTATVNTSATLVLSQYDAGTLYFISTSAAIFFNTDAGAGSPLTTKGDIYVYGTSDTRLPVGTNGHTLVADSAETTGLKWAAVTVPTLPAFRAYSSGGTSLTGAAWTKLTFDTEVFDTDNKFSSDRFTPGTAGYYQVSARARLNASGTSNSLYLSIYKNGSTDAEDGTETNSYPSGNPSVLIYLDSDDYIEVYAYSAFSVSTNSGAAMQYFSAVGVRS